MPHLPQTRRWMSRATVACILALALGGSAGSALAHPNADRESRQAYAAAMKCYVANTNAASLRTEAGDPAKAAIYKANAKRSFEGAVQLGRGMGLSNRQMNQDLDATEAREISRMVADKDYFVRSVATCKALGLM